MSDFEDIKELIADLERAYNGECFIDGEGEEYDWDFQCVYETFDALIEQILKLKSDFVLSQMSEIEDRMKEQLIKQIENKRADD